MSNKLIKLFFFSVLAICFGCAQVVAPSGGIKDIHPPKIVKYTPENKTSNFNGNTITLRFDEFIQLNQPEEQIIISPPLLKKPQIISKGKSIEIKFDEILQPNTTYTINFGNAIGDNTENNKLENTTYVFSTGTTIDTQYIAGKVLHAYTQQPIKNALVALYDDMSYTDSVPFKNKPLYIGKTTDYGSFSLYNLPLKNFKLIVFSDLNKNLLYDKNEPIGFINNTLSSKDSSSKQLTTYVFDAELYPIGSLIDTFTRSTNKYTIIGYKLNNAMVHHPETYTQLINTSTGMDTVHVFTKTKDSVAQFKISVNGITHPLRIKNSPLHKPDLLNITYPKNIELNDTIPLVFNHPILTIDTSRILLLKDSTPIHYHYVSSDFKLKIVYPWEEKSMYKLVVKDSALMDFYNQYNIGFKQGYSTKAIKDYGNLLLHVKVPTNVKNNYIIQLYTNELKPEYTFYLTKSETINITNALPGNYTIKAIYDENGNHLWDNGDFLKNQLPEKVHIWPQPITLKAYWDLEQSILIE